MITAFRLVILFTLFATFSRKNPFWLYVALDDSQKANGELYWDDGETLSMLLVCLQALAVNVGVVCLQSLSVNLGVVCLQTLSV